MEKTSLTILFTSDIHGSVLPINYGSNDYSPIGLATYATIVEKIRSRKENVLVLDNGDLIQGTPLITHYMKELTHQKHPMIEIMNKIGIDASVIGNHEFNYGKDVLTKAIQDSKFPWLSANILNKDTKEPMFGQPYMIKQLDNGVKIAVVGVTTDYIPHWESPEHIQGITFTDARDTLEQWVNYVRKTEAPDLVIASYHGGFERDLSTGERTERETSENQGYAMCETIEGIDLLLTGHQHRQLTGEINGIPVLQPGKNGEQYGKVTIQLTKEQDAWNKTSITTELCSLETVESREDIVSYIQPFEDSTQKWLDQPLGYTKGDMTIQDPLEVRKQAHPFISFIQRVQKDVSGAPISVTALLNNDTTGFRSTVTMRDVVSNYMYPNTLTVLKLTGADIRAAIEQSACYFMLDEDGEITVNPEYIEPKPQHYNYDMWEGVEYTIRVSKPFGKRLEKLTYHDEPIKDDDTFDVVINNYRASGGGEFHMFPGKPIVKEIQKDTVELIHSYFERYPTIEATTPNNFIVLP
ncbi:MAG TPA: bifunctional UDP-sugar hydrolase/5'-nucleotidase [Bacillota bacterium]|nr:bifunctional UDP-sugar hydrolase/5'-nucleotidase [Bacillota bacterium]